MRVAPVKYRKNGRGHRIMLARHAIELELG